ncbi:MAG: hypothetical protein ACLQGT_00005 [Terracidiphilus sp.]
MNSSIKLDKYAADYIAWGQGAEINYAASRELFKSDNLVVWLPAAVLAHHALEMALKAALICEGMIVFNPKLLNRLDSTISFLEEDCVWGHKLIPLAEKLMAKRKDFDLDLGNLCTSLRPASYLNKLEA